MIFSNTQHYSLPPTIFLQFLRIFLMPNYFSNTPQPVELKMPRNVGNVTTVILQLPIICLQWKSLTVCYQFTANSFFYHYLHSLITKSIASDTLSNPFNSCNQSLPNTEIKSHWTLIPFLLNPLPNYYLKLTTLPISIQSHPITPFNLWLLKTVMKTTLNNFKSLWSTPPITHNSPTTHHWSLSIIMLIPPTYSYLINQSILIPKCNQPNSL